MAFGDSLRISSIMLRSIHTASPSSPKKKKYIAEYFDGIKVLY